MIPKKGKNKVKNIYAKIHTKTMLKAAKLQGRGIRSIHVWQCGWVFNTKIIF
jgi:hypothetical protein